MERKSSSLLQRVLLILLTVHQLFAGGPLPPERNWTTDGVSTPDTEPWPTTVVPQVLGAWSFDNAELSSSFSDGPRTVLNVYRIPTDVGMALRVHDANAASIRFSVRQSNTNGDFSVRHGTASFWFRPAWSSGTDSAPSAPTPLLEVGANRIDRVGWWALQLTPGGRELYFLTQAGGVESMLLRTSIQWSANTWYHLALTWSLTGSVLWINGQPVATGLGVTRWPALAERERWGWGLGSDASGSLQAHGDFDTLVTFNYPLSANAVAALARSPRMPSPEEFVGLGTGLWIQLRRTDSMASGWLQGTEAGLTYEIFTAPQLYGPWKLGCRLTGSATKTWFENLGEVETSLLLSAAVVSDQDGDGLSDEFERRVSKTSSTNADTDQDAMPDDWEVRYALNPLSSTDQNGDLDGDGFPNELEYRLGRDPRVSEVLPMVSVSSSTAFISEAGPAAQFVVRRTGPITQPLEVFFELRGRAANGVDYVGIPAHVTIPTGASQAVIPIQPIRDGLDETDEPVVLELVPGADYGLDTNPSATLVLIDQDLPIVSLRATDATAREPRGTWIDNGELELRRDGLLDQPLTVSLRRSGTAIPLQDDTGIPTSVTFPIGEALVRIPVLPRDNGMNTGPRTLGAEIVLASHYRIDPDRANATVVIEDIQQPVVTVVASDPDAGEQSNPGAFRFTRTGSLAQALTVHYRVGGTATAKANVYAQADYASLPGVVIIPAGSTDQTVLVSPYADTVEECLETVTVVLGGSLDYTIGNPSEATVFIDDASANRVSSQTVAACSGRESGPFAWVDVTRTGSTAAALTVPLEIRGRRFWNGVWYDFKDVPAAAGASYGMWVDGQPANSILFPKGVSRRRISVKSIHPTGQVPNATVVVDPYGPARRDHFLQFLEPKDQVSLGILGPDLIEGATGWILLTAGSPICGPEGTNVRLKITGEASPQDYTVSGAVQQGDEWLVNIPPAPANTSKRQVILQITAKADGIVENPSEHLVVNFDQTQTGSGLVSDQQSKPFVALRIRDDASQPVLPLDSDGDHLPDDYEVAMGLDPRVPTEWIRDTDRDGLGDREEFLLKTRYDQSDTDGDGLNDFMEGILGLNALARDASQMGLASERVAIRLRTAGSFREANNNCYRCHAPFMRVGDVVLSNETAAGGSESGGVLERIVLFRKGISLPVTLVSPPRLAPTGGTEWYDAEILPADPTVVPGFVVLDAAIPILGKSREFKSTTFTGSATLRVLNPPRLLVDADRDGSIRTDESDATSESRPFRFWVNNDGDTGDQSEVLNTTTPDHADYRISNRRDLEDFTRLWIDVENFRDLLTLDGFELALEWRNTGGTTPAIQVYPAVEPDGGLGYLQNEAIANQQSLPNATLPYYTWALADTSLTRRTVRAGTRFVFQRSVWSTQPKRLNLIFEGAASGRGELVALLLRNGQVVSASQPLHLQLRDIKQMYQRAQAGPIDGFLPSFQYGQEQPPAVWTGFSGWSLGFNFDPAPTETPTAAVFVHGWNMKEDESVNFAETMFKRLWQAGFTGRFCAFRWPTYLYSEPTLVDSFNASEHRAWEYGTALKSFVETLPAAYSRNIIAHSMGGVLTASALRQGMSVRNTLMMQAALSASTLDPREILNWGRLVLGESAAENGFHTPDAYSTERGYRGLIADTSTRVFNYYNENDYALQTGSFGGSLELNWIANQLYQKPHWPGMSDYRRYSWQPNARKSPVDQRMRYVIKQRPESIVRFVTEAHEGLAFLARSRTRALGAEPAAAGLVQGGQGRDLSRPPHDFRETRSDHSGQFYLPGFRTWALYRTVLNDLNTL